MIAVEPKRGLAILLFASAACASVGCTGRTSLDVPGRGHADPGDRDADGRTGGDVNPGDSGQGTDPTGASDPEPGDPLLPYTVVVTPAYPNGVDWNDYVETAVGNAVCTGDELGSIDVCLHAGPIRQVVTREPSCAGLELTDTLGAFRWDCAMSTQTVAVFRSTLRPDRGLADLVDETGWLDNGVTLTAGGINRATSAPAAWWGNPVYVLPDNAAGCMSGPGYTCDGASGQNTQTALLAAPGGVYVVPAGTNRLTTGYRIDANRISIVTLPGAVLTGSFVGKNCNGWNLDAAAAADACLLFGLASRFLWLEGAFDSRAADLSLAFYDIRFSTFRRIDIACAAATCIRFNDSDSTPAFQSRYNRVSQVRGTGGTWLFELICADGNRFDRVTQSNASGRIAFLWNANYNVFTDAVAINTTSAAFYLGGAADHAPFASSHNTFTGVTSMNSGGIFGAYTYTPPAAPDPEFYRDIKYNILLNGLAVNSTNAVYSATNGILDTYFSGNTFAQVAAASNPAGSFNVAKLDYVSSNRFTGNLVVGNNAGNVAGAVCAVTNSPTDAGVGAGCASTVGSNAHLVTSVNANTSVVGAATSDAQNNAEVSGMAVASSIGFSDLVHFETMYRAWGLDGATVFPANAHRGTCTAAQTCRIWDAALRATDSAIRDHAANGAVANDPFIAGAPCPGHLHGDEVLDSAEYPFDLNYLAGIGANAVQTQPTAGGPCNAASTFCKRRFAKNAIEIIDPDWPEWRPAGNHDGLCESGESCLYTPNFGAYQGHGALATCVFTDGTISGVTMWGFAQNGY